jgi:hypothetical protein
MLLFSCRLQHFSYIREFTDRPMNSRQAVLANVAKNVVDTDAGEARQCAVCMRLQSARDSLKS